MVSALFIAVLVGLNCCFRKLTRAKFEEINMDLFKKTLEPVKVGMCALFWLVSRLLFRMS